MQQAGPPGLRIQAGYPGKAVLRGDSQPRRPDGRGWTFRSASGGRGGHSNDLIGSAHARVIFVFNTSFQLEQQPPAFLTQGKLEDSFWVRWEDSFSTDQGEKWGWFGTPAHSVSIVYFISVFITL